VERIRFVYTQREGFVEIGRLLRHDGSPLTFDYMCPSSDRDLCICFESAGVFGEGAYVAGPWRFSLTPTEARRVIEACKRQLGDTQWTENERRAAATRNLVAVLECQVREFEKEAAQCHPELLLVEEDEQLTDALCTGMPELGLDINAVPNGVLAEYLLRERLSRGMRLPRVLLIDHTASTQRGTRLLNYVQSELGLASVPVFQFSAYFDVMQHPRAQFLFRKPFQLDALLSALREYVGPLRESR
jgi:hypothetical protein